ncbi:hypothetical protein Scep_024335 [Stephania cephalantha]|uniref:Uncharacterized protein n=1 Tax=Stephania cephalantha TaxID=152367 RepID=A0AAP0HYD0_9MAGN
MQRQRRVGLKTSKEDIAKQRLVVLQVHDCRVPSVPLGGQGEEGGRRSERKANTGALS